MKVLSLVLHFYTNMVASGPEYASKLLHETSIQHIFQYILQNDIASGEEEIMRNSIKMVQLLTASY